jgi:hypothetical protein
VTIRKHKAIAIRPNRILRIETEDTIPKDVDERSKGHRGTGVSGMGLLNGINRERADRIDAQLIEL